MTEEMVMKIGSDAIVMIVMLAGPMLAAAMVIGIIVSILQAVTQINEATLTFIPKMIAIILVLVVMAPWMLKTFQEYTISIIGNASDFIK